KDLPESYREALVLRYVDGLSFREVAEATGVSEENARARVHRGRVALHKVLSRLAVMAAFLIPGLKRTQAASSTGADQAVTVSDHAAQTVNLTTQLTSHVMTAAPTVSRLAETASGIPSGAKSALAAAAVTAVAAVAAPVAYHQVQDSNRSPKVPAAVAGPADTHDASRGGAILPGGKSTTTTVAGAATSTSTSSSIPDTDLHPFGIGAPTTTTTEPRSETSTTTSTTSTTQPVNQGPVLEGRLAGDTITVTGTAPQWDAKGSVSLSVKGKTSSGTIEGRLFIYDDGNASADQLVVTLGDHTLDLRFQGRWTKTVDGTTTSYKITGQYLFKGAADFGLAEQGDLSALFRLPASGPAGLTFDLRGQGRS
ncbi:MAG: hypothetical protein JWM47_1332, partial [Acidimicrobiales bacterium]|nr:hypothetical protein [Acidimicrobiales bacterium]